jgi:hypothetical protein
VGGVVFKAYQLGLTLKARSRVTDPDWVDLNWREDDGGAPMLDRCR